MEIKGKVHCLFEQSGTFKNEFKKLGIPAEDYDIQNNFRETDHVIDLFAEIDRAYDNLTARQQDSKTARQQDSKTARQQDSKTARHDIRHNRPMSRPCCGVLSMYLFLRKKSNEFLLIND